jgi:hypothetical protein
LPSRFAGRVAVAAINTLYAVWIGEYILSVFKADFVPPLVFGVLVFVPNDPAAFHVFSVLHFALHIKGGILKYFSGAEGRLRGFAGGLPGPGGFRFRLLFGAALTRDIIRGQA